MKMHIFSLLISLFFLSSIQAQLIKTRLDFVGGVGYPEYIHGGLRYQYADKTQLGIYYGGDMGFNTTIIRTWNLDHFYHFGKHSYHSNRPVWYARQGLTFSSHTENDRTRKYTYINVAAGRDFCIRSWVGVNADIGWIWQIREKIVYKDPLLPTKAFAKWDWLPLLRVQLYFSL